MIRGVLFDIDDTLFDYSGAERSGFLAHLAERNLLDDFATPEDAVALWRQILEEEWARHLTGELTFTGQQLSRTRRFHAETGRLPADGLTDEDAAAWFAGYAAHRDAHWSAFSDADPVLTTLAPNYRLGVVSNSVLSHQRDKLQAVGLLGYFDDAVICSDTQPAPKPAAVIFHAGCAKLGLSPQEVAFVGDNYSVDAVGARDAGLHAYWLDRRGESRHNQAGNGIRVIHTLDELPDSLIE